MNEGYTKDERKIIGGYTALIPLRYGLDIEEIRRRYGGANKKIHGK